MMNHNEVIHHIEREPADEPRPQYVCEVRSRRTGYWHHPHFCRSWGVLVELYVWYLRREKVKSADFFISVIILHGIYGLFDRSRTAYALWFANYKTRKVM